MPESLLSFSNILLFGEKVSDLKVLNLNDAPPDNPGQGPKRLGNNKQLAHQLTQDGVCYAKIYGFSYEGRYYDLARPTLFLVHGDGHSVTNDHVDGNPNDSRAPRKSALSGLSAADFDFADDIQVWSYDKGDYTIRMDAETGRFEQLLLEAEMDEDELASFYSGQRARTGGQRARVGGQRARVSGQRVRIGDRGGD